MIVQDHILPQGRHVAPPIPTPSGAILGVQRRGVNEVHLLISNSAARYLVRSSFYGRSANFFDFLRSEFYVQSPKILLQVLVSTTSISL